MPEPGHDDLADMPLPEGLVLFVPGQSPRPFDDTEPGADRQAELRTCYSENVAAGRPPYADVAIRTRGELDWVMRERDWSGDLDPQGKGPADLRRADLSETDLRGASLLAANLDGAKLRTVVLSGVILSRANLRGADLLRANLSEAVLDGVSAAGAGLTQVDLRGASMSGSDFSEARLDQSDLSGALVQAANLQKVGLYGAKLGGANLRWADLRGANLATARLDQETILAEARLDSTTVLGDIAWNGAPLTEVDWLPVARTGDEGAARERMWVDPRAGVKARKPRDERIREYRRVARTYRALALALKQQGLGGLAVAYNARAERMDCHVLFHEAAAQSPRRQMRSFCTASLRWLMSCVVYGFIWVSAHLGWLLFLYAAFILSFALVYLGLGTQGHTGLSSVEALVLSLTSFHGRGLSPATGLDDAMRLVAGVEAVFGLLTEALFIAAFTRRVMGS